MGIRKTLRDLTITLRSIAKFKTEMKNIIHRRNEWKHTILTEQQIAVANAFMKENYGKTIPLWWHRLYTSYTGVFDEKYFPEILFSTVLEEKLNPFYIAKPLENKAFNPQILFRDINLNDKIRTPKYLCVSCYGVIWNNEDEIVDYKWVLREISEEEHIIKPTITTTGAKDVRLIRIVNGIDVFSGELLESIIKSYGGNFVIQERVKNHHSIAKVYPNSINSLRVITFICENNIHVAPLCMRFGIKGRVVDNAGIFIGVDKGGFLRETGFSKLGLIRYYSHPDTKVMFKGYRIEGVSNMIDAAIKMHSRLPQLKMISWDLAFDENENVVIIEANTTSQSIWFPQMVNGESIFGEYTAKMYELIR